MKTLEHLIKLDELKHPYDPDRKAELVDTGFEGYQLCKGQLDLLCAEPGGGTTYASLLSVLRTKERVGLISFQDTEQSLTKKLIAAQAGIHINRVCGEDLTDEELVRMDAARAEIRYMEGVISCYPSMDDEFGEVCKQMTKSDCELVWIDGYSSMILENVKGAHPNRFISCVRHLSNHYQKAVVVTCPLGEEGNVRSPKMVMAADSVTFLERVGTSDKFRFRTEKSSFGVKNG